MSEELRAAIYDVVSDNNIPWNELKDKTVLVTGATGVIGGILVRALFAANMESGLNMHIIGCGRNRGKGEILVKELNLEFLEGDIGNPEMLKKISTGIDFIVHCASITKSADMVSRPVEVIMTAANGTKNMLDLAKETACKGFVFLSSMEIYGGISKAEVCESDLGYLDLSNPRSSYPESKRFCEAMCVAYSKQYGIPVKIARLARTFGAGVSNDEDDMRVASQFIRRAIAGQDIELHTEGRSIANCCDTSDAVRGILTILLKGESGEAYTVANPLAGVTIKEMAEIVANDVCGGKIKVVVNIPEDIKKRGYAPDVGYRLNIEKIEKLGWKPQYNISEMYKRMFLYWKGI